MEIPSEELEPFAKPFHAQEKREEQRKDRSNPGKDWYQLRLWRFYGSGQMDGLEGLLRSSHRLPSIS